MKFAGLVLNCDGFVESKTREEDATTDARWRDRGGWESSH